MRVLALHGFDWAHLLVWAGAGVGALAAVSVVVTLLHGQFSAPPQEAVLAVGAVVVTSYVDIDFGAGVALTLGACPLVIGVVQYVRGRAIDSRSRLHTSPEEWAAHFAMDGTCPCADASVKRPGERGAGTPASAGCSTSALEPVESASRSGLAPAVAGRPENTRPDAAGERQVATPLPVDAPAAARHHVSVSEPDAAARPGGDVVPHPRLKTSEPAWNKDKSPAFHVSSSVAVLAEAG